MISYDGEDIASKGRILLFQVKKSKKRFKGRGGGKLPSLFLSLKSEKEMALGPVTSLSSLQSENTHRVVVGAGAEVTVEQWGSGKLTQVGEYVSHMRCISNPVVFRVCNFVSHYFSRFLSCSHAGSRNCTFQNVFLTE